LKVQNEHSKLVDLPDVEIATLKELGKSLKLQQLIKLAQIFSDIEKKMSFNINERWIMEATLINCIATLRKNNQ
jgi:DNA polymerase III gamma/tau subunit